ncbi:MAG: hypothetical protein JWO76_3458 [Nocardioides sp.]|nr:hypothetical protein [Nocardioides sp.]
MAGSGCYTERVRLPESTLDGIESRAEGRAATWGRRAFLLLLLALVAAGMAGLLGVATTSSTAEGGGYELTLEHATRARAGLDVPWQVTVHHPGGFGKSLTLAVTGDYFDIYETQGFTPDASAATRDGDTLYLTFDAPPGDTFVVAYDAYIQPSSQQGRAGSVSVLVDGSREATVDFRTRLLP